MEANAIQLLKFLKDSPQFDIPIYQRTYSWTEEECRQLWDDIVNTGLNTDDTVEHFIGSIVYVKKSSLVSQPHPLLVIDGQQRLATVTLLLSALAEALGDDEPIDGFSARKVRNYYLLNPEEKNGRHYKLLLSQTDKDTLISIVSKKDLPVSKHSIRIKQNFDLFKEWIDQDKGKLDTICKGLNKLMVVQIGLDRDNDNPQLIFESMNSTGRELSQADLIRNFILMKLESARQTEIWEQFWHPMEITFGQKAYDTHFDGFMRDYLTMKSETGNIPKKDEVYKAFKKYFHGSNADVDTLAKEIKNYAHHYCVMALDAESAKNTPDLKVAFHDLQELKVSVAYPLLLELYHDYEEDILTEKDLLQAVRMIETYVFRRAICDIPTNSMNKTFSTFTKPPLDKPPLDKDRYLQSIKAHFLGLQGRRRFPDDEEFKRKIQIRDLYNFRSRSYWLRRFENFGRKEMVSVNEYTIEHIMPQNKNLSSEWREALGQDVWETVHGKWLHTLGNLTLTGYNSKYIDKPFSEKRDMENGFQDSPLKVNKGLGQLDTWNEETIKERAEKLAQEALTVWPAPSLPEEILATYKPDITLSESDTIADPSLLISPALRELFELLRKEVIALDPDVTEEFLKHYVAYKVETNFVDVIPQKKQLKLILNMPFVELSDPKGLSRDVSEIGRQGNGEVEIKLSQLEDIPYVIGLIRQSLERQIEGEE